jgi:hypothetical protein
VTIDITFPKSEGLPGYKLALDRVCAEASQAIVDGMKVIILSDRAVGPDRVPLSSLVACGGVHHHLVAQKKRARVALMIETGEAREVHHLCVLLGYGADAICPWLILQIIHKLSRERLSVAFSFFAHVLILIIFPHQRQGWPVDRQAYSKLPEGKRQWYPQGHEQDGHLDPPIVQGRANL